MFSLVFCVVRALRVFEFRLVIKEETTSYCDRDSCFWQVLYVFSPVVVAIMVLFPSCEGQLHSHE